MNAEQVPQGLERSRETLASLTNEPCGFAHEFRGGGDICDSTRRRINVCCAHGFLDVAIPRVIDRIHQEGLMSDAEKESLTSAWNDSQALLRQADNTVFMALNGKPSDVIAPAQELQKSLGDERMRIARLLIDFIDGKASEPKSPTTLETKSVQLA